MAQLPDLRLLEFGDFTVNPRARSIHKHGIRLKLHGQPFEILLLLLDRPGEVVTREELQAKLWPANTFVDFEHGVNTAVKKLRRTLGDSADEPRFIETVPRIGYRFIAPAVVSQGLIGIQAGVATEILGTPSPVEPSAATIGIPACEPMPARHVVLRRLALGFAGVLGLVALFYFFRPAVPPPLVTRIRKITDLGSGAVIRNLVTDGPRIYFVLDTGGKDGLLYVSTEGGAIVPMEKPFPGMELTDISPSGRELLVQSFGKEVGPRSLWRVPVTGGSPRRVGDLLAEDSGWSADGRQIAYTVGSDPSLYVANSDGSNSRKLATLPGLPFKPRWSPDGKILRFSLFDVSGEGFTLWQSDLAGASPHELLSDWPSSARALAGRWTTDGRYFFFDAVQDGMRNVWALRDRRDLLRKSASRPIRLTAGPMSFFLPTPSKDAKSIFVVGEEVRGQLMRYDERSHQFVPFVPGLSADQVTFSRDGKWIAYVHYPEGTIFRSRADGTAPLQLTFPPGRAIYPQWSPDGTQIAFQGFPKRGGPRKAYVISANGEGLRSLGPSRGELHGGPFWSPDGASVLFSSSDSSNSHMGLQLLNVKTGKMVTLQGSAGLEPGPFSPDGKWIAAASASRLVLYDTLSHTARRLPQLASYPSWSADGKYVYFNNLMWRAWRGREQSGIYALRVSDGTIQQLLIAPDIELASNWGIWTGMTPDGSLLILRNTGTQNIYALDVDLP
ncbi:MAG TPA: winged helix-turn-helix domain-containing protein [Edaphobacter sp.]|uniref:winged helix-turn-helix domain-containing protein n=1 Tax=Edaphobacter sp. TaxID=1934404 RepID=UPI002C325685|nr:winged helix-turn-helix domain-containing protein [Edaphobacter sp.]HUZ96852.1 winged helix-turn-helix domain-containing protein [Edaphobacter sp.]